MSDLYAIECVSKMPLIMHHDNIDGQEEIRAWIDAKENAKKSVPGDDRTPPWTWQTYLYHDDEHVVITAENLMSCLLYAGSKTKIIGAKKGNYKTLSQTGLQLQAESFPLLVRNRPILMREIRKLRDLTFAEQVAGAIPLGFKLFKKRVQVGKAKHVRVRPVFPNWSIRILIQITDSAITPQGLAAVLMSAGDAGLCDWRPGVEYPKRPGMFGRFEAKMRKA